MIAPSPSDAETPREHQAPETVATNPAAALEHSERRSAVRRALSALPHEQREVLLLKEYEGLKFREIADVLGVAESTVKSRMYAGLDAMRMSREASASMGVGFCNLESLIGRLYGEIEARRCGARRTSCASCANTDELAADACARTALTPRGWPSSARRGSGLLARRSWAALRSGWDGYALGRAGVVAPSPKPGGFDGGG